MATIGYLRGDDQSQADALAMIGVDRVYRDGINAGRLGRPGLRAAVGSLKHGETLAVTRLSDLGLSIRNVIAFAEDLRHRGIHLVVIGEQIDTATDGPRGWDFFQLLAALGSMERELFAERQQLGLAAAAGRPRKAGRKHALTAEQVEAARQQLADPSVTVKGLSRKLRVSKMTIYRNVLANNVTDITA